jgi:hypothetical protein
MTEMSSIDDSDWVVACNGAVSREAWKYWSQQFLFLNTFRVCVTSHLVIDQESKKTAGKFGIPQ